VNTYCDAHHPDTPPLAGSRRGPAQREETTAAERAAYGVLGVLWCGRLAGHPGEHSAWRFNISAPPITWPADEVTITDREEVAS
jgi:hypothetical protein